jgi:hypothetical protein
MKENIILTAIFLIMVCPVFSASNVTVSPKEFNVDTGTWLTVTADVTQGADVDIFVAVDFNSNGVKDPEDFIYLQCKLKEGVPTPFLNSSIPGDEDGLNSHISTHLDFWDVPQTAGNFMVIVNDAAGAASDTYKITQTETAQYITGTLRLDSGTPSPGVPGVVEAEDAEERYWDVLTDAGGVYKLCLPEGKYDVFGYIPGMLLDCTKESVKRNIVLNAGQSISGVDLTLYNGTCTIKGRVVNSSTGEGVPNLMVDGSIEDGSEPSNYESLAFTDTSGNFQLPAVPGPWGVGLGDNLYFTGLVGPNEKMVSVGENGLEDVIFSLSPATTYITGTLTRYKDETPVTGYDVEVENEDEGIFLDVYTRGPDGSYFMPILPGTWWVAVESDQLARDRWFAIPPFQLATPAVDSPTTGVNFTLREPTAFVNLSVKEAGTSTPIGGVGVRVRDENWDILYGLKTDANGNATLRLLAGTYHISLNSDDLYLLGYFPVDYQDITLADGETKPLLFSVPKYQAFINGHIAHNSIPIIDIDVSLWSDSYSYVRDTTSDNNGDYKFAVLAGTYYVSLDGGGLIEQGFAPVAPQRITISSGTVNVDFAIPSSTATINVHIQSGGNPVQGITAYVKQPGMPLSIADRRSDSTGVAYFPLTAGTYNVGLSQDDLLNKQFLPMNLMVKNVTIVDGQTLDLFYNLHSYNAQGAIDAILGRFVPDSTERSYLDKNHDWRLDAGDVITFLLGN